MILQEEFRNNGYEDILIENTASIYEINLEDIYDKDNKPDELLGIFISKQKDELFFIINGNSKINNINLLCDEWDDRIRVFTIINDRLEVIHKLKYNIVQLIVYSNGSPDRSREGNLLISRKIIIKGNMTNKDKIIIDDDEAIELPFHMISEKEYMPDVERINQLSQLLPDDNKLLEIMENKQNKINRKEKDQRLAKSFEEQDYEKIKEWLMNDNS